MIKRYGLRRTKLPVSGVIAPDITECHDGEYVRVESYEHLKRQNEELRSIVGWCQWRISAAYKDYVQRMIDRLEKL